MVKDRRKLYESIVVKFDAPKGYKLDEYYGTMMMKMKKNNKFQVKLIYDYKAHSVTSSPIVVNELDKCLKLIELLEEFAKDGTEKSDDVNNMLDDI